MSHTTQCPSDAGCLAGEAPAEATKMQSDRLRRATRIVQYFPYTDLTTPSEVQKKSAHGQVSRRPDRRAILAWRKQPRVRKSPPCAEQAQSVRTPAPCLRLELLARRGAQSVPGVADLMVVD